MLWLWIVLFSILIICAGVIGFFFRIAFVRMKETTPFSQSNALSEYRDIIDDGIQYIKRLKYVPISVSSFDGLRLCGKYFNNNFDRTIILFHGYRSIGYFDFSCAVKFYIELGLNVLIVDQRAHGDSEGKLITFGIKERYDVLSWVNFLLEEYGQKDILISGVSMGATTVLMASNLNLPKNVKGIIADCGFTSAADIIKIVGKRAFHIKGTVLIPILDIVCRFFGKFSIYEISTVDSLKESDVPVFFIHGKSDGFVPCDMTERAYAAANAEKYICIVDGADHGLSFLVDTDNIKRKIKNFIETH